MKSSTKGTAIAAVGDALADVGLEVSEVLYNLGDMLRGWAEDGEGVEATDVLERLTCGAVDALMLAQRFVPDLTSREVFAAAIAVVGALPGGPGVQAEVSDAVRAQWEADCLPARPVEALSRAG